MSKLYVAVHSVDPLTRCGLECTLERNPQFVLTPVDKADVVVAALDTVDATALETLTVLDTRQGTRFVVIVGRGWYVDPSSAIECGIRAVLWREEATANVVVRVVATVAAGDAWFPPSVQGRLVDQVEHVQREVLRPRGLTSSGLTAREIEVLRMVSEGLDLSEIAQKMSYSERTIKKIISSVMSRLGLRNRVHAVTYAIRAGLI